MHWHFEWQSQEGGRMQEHHVDNERQELRIRVAAIREADGARDPRDQPHDRIFFFFFFFDQLLLLGKLALHLQHR